MQIPPVQTAVRKLHEELIISTLAKTAPHWKTAGMHFFVYLLRMTDEKNVAFLYRHDAESGEPYEFNFSKAWTGVHTEFDCKETDTKNIDCEYGEYDK